MIVVVMYIMYYVSSITDNDDVLYTKDNVESMEVAESKGTCMYIIIIIENSLLHFLSTIIIITIICSL